MLSFTNAMFLLDSNLLHYIVQATCTEIALKLRNAKGVDVVLCFHKFIDHVCLQMLIVCLDKYSN